MASSTKAYAPLVSYWIMLFAIGMGWFILSPLVPSIVQSLNVQTSLVIFIITLYGYAMVIFGLVAGYISAVRNVYNSLLASAILTFVGLTVRAFVNRFDLFFSFSVIAAVGYPLAMAPVGSVADSISPKSAHTVIGISVGLLFFGMAVGSFTAPGLEEHFGLKFTLIVPAILSAISLVLIASMHSSFPRYYRARSLKGSFSVGMVKNWYVGLSIASMSVMFSSIAASVLIMHNINHLQALNYAGIFGGLAFVGSAFGAVLLPLIFGKYGGLKIGLIVSGLLSFFSISILAILISLTRLLSAIAVSYFIFGFFGNAYWSMAMTSVTYYASSPDKAGLSTAMFSVASNAGVAVIPVFLGTAFLRQSTLILGVSIVLAMEFVSAVLAFTLKYKPS
ncbi:hypothetical protein [Thermoplasma volcanium GSS1]|uniref:Major facilitator superfamily (MFS) profile domain-containing protein n=1 Tax=Thermoplasma volcanium (strain ATCC 51530 / DSM 4299 / JCM 9571 / NBRC 15438 / GSS1) TaxID=273116 RepID=Q979S3_THEVO|nr:MFS transporter [Thermoplasma volcanium]BAB60229.1 hypothetical protein [Thermoplasma volcanium GSS1]